VRRLFPFRKMVLALILVAASVFLMNVTGRPASGPSFWEVVFWRCAEPVSSVYSKSRGFFNALSLAFQSKEALTRENQKLREELVALESLRAKLAELESENERLKDLLGFKEETPGEYRAAKVIGRETSKWFSTVTISLGEEDGILLDAPVVSRTGLLGRVLSVGPKSAKVLLLTDAESGVGAVVGRSREYGILFGGHGPDRLVLRLFSKEADVSVGDQVLTSGMGSKYPQGIPIGEVVEVYVPGPGLVKECLVKPFSDFSHLEEVLVKIR